jgi:glycosyltransferase involved in cell wall biosynthesis
LVLRGEQRTDATADALPTVIGEERGTEPRRVKRSVRTRVRGCRVVTTSLTARVLLANQLRSLDDFEWTVVSGDGYEDPPDGVAVEMVPIRREFALSDARSFLDLVRLFRRRRFAFVQTHTPKASVLGLPAARLAGTTAIYTIHGALYFEGNSRLANVLGWCFERWCCAWATRVLVQSREDADVLPKAKVCAAGKLAYVGNGIVLERFLEPVAPALESELPLVVMVSRLVTEKGCRDFIALAGGLSRRACFVHVGPFEHDQSDAISEAEVTAATESGDVTFVGGVDDVRPYLASATLVVLPSYREGIPRVAMEAAAMGKPVAAYDIRGVREVIDPGTGLLVARGDRLALTRLVGELVADPARCAVLGAYCREWVVDRFSEDKVVERLRATYAALDRASA